MGRLLMHSTHNRVTGSPLGPTGSGPRQKGRALDRVPGVPPLREGPGQEHPDPPTQNRVIHKHWVPAQTTHPTNPRRPTTPDRILSQPSEQGPLRAPIHTTSATAATT